MDKLNKKTFIVVHSDIAPFWLVHEVIDTGKYYRLLLGYSFTYDSEAIIKIVTEAQAKKLKKRSEELKSELRDLITQHQKKCKDALKL